MIIHGINPVMEALKHRGRFVERLLVVRGSSNPRLEQLISEARELGIPIRFEKREALNRLAETSRHQDVLAVLVEIPICGLEEILESKPQLLLLIDNVEDPRNLGAVLRTAEAVGVDGVLLPDRRSCGLTATVVKASAGAALHLRIARIGNVVQALERLKASGLWIAGLDASGPTSPQDLDPELPLALVVGGEHRGVRPLVRRHCDFLVSLPMKGQVNSLNLSVAAGAALYLLLMARPPAAG